MDPILIAAVGAAVFAFLSKSAKKSAPTQEEKKPQSTQKPVDVPTQVGGLIGGLLASTGVVSTGSITSGVSAFGSAVGGFFSSAAPALVAIAPAVIILICSKITQLMSGAKQFSSNMFKLLPNARALCAFESNHAEEMFRQNGVTFSKTVVQDSRLDFNVNGEKIHFIGERVVYAKTNDANALVPDFLTLQKMLRSCAYVFLHERARYGFAYLTNWGPKIGLNPSSIVNLSDGLSNYYKQSMYGEALGGLNQVPLIGGYTETHRDNPEDTNPPAAQLRGVNTEPIDNEIIARWYQLARFEAFKEALEILAFDNAVYFPFDANRYARDVFERLRLDPKFFILDGHVLTLPKTVWGFENTITVDIIDVKDHGAGANWGFN